MAEYITCKVRDKVFAKCGQYLPRHDHVMHCVKDLQNDVKDLIKCPDVISECELILNRAKYLSVELEVGDLICPNHRHWFGTEWRPPVKCLYTHHNKQSKEKGRKVSWDTFEKAKSLDPSFPISGLICRSCTLSLVNEDGDDDNEDDESFQVPYSIDDTEYDIGKNNLDTLSDVLQLPRVKHQIKSSVTEISDKSIWYFKNYYKKITDTLETKFSEWVAPGQSSQFRTRLEASNLEDVTVPTDIEHLVSAYKSCQTVEAMTAVLTLIPKKYKKQEICSYFGCTLYRIATARQRLKLHGPCAMIEKQHVSHSRIPKNKIYHFIEFLFSTGLLKEEAYGVSKLKFDSGDNIIVTNTILEGLNAHAIREYQIYCSEINVAPLSTTTLKLILNAIKPKHRQKIAAVDTFLVEAFESFTVLNQQIIDFHNMNIINATEKVNAVHMLSEAKSYLKARYQFHCETDSACASHCISHALTHPTDRNLQSRCSGHTLVCKDCYNLILSLEYNKQKIDQVQDEHLKSQLMFDWSNACSKIYEWQNHILRGVQQNKARIMVMNVLSPSNTLWIRDWAQKINPTKTLEGMNEYFGKRGMSLSIEVFLTKYHDKWHKKVYLVALDHCDQGLLDALSVADIVLKQFSIDHPEIKTINYKSDNAGSYHANNSAEALHVIAKKYGKFLQRIDFNESQKGKDQCDREAAYVKFRKEWYINKDENHKITNCKELMHAVMSNGGPKNTKMCVAQITKSKAKITQGRNIPNISNYHTILFDQESGATYHEFFEIGKGNRYPFSGIIFESGGEITQNWISSERQNEAISLSATQKIIRCEEPLCTRTFSNEEDLYEHLTSPENHEFATAKTTGDLARTIYIEQKQLMTANSSSSRPTTTEVSGEDQVRFESIFKKGFARHIKKYVKFSEKQKQFVLNQYEIGAQTKAKKSPETISNEMRHVLAQDGSYLFEATEYLSPVQVRGLIQRIGNQTASEPQRKRAKIDSDDDSESVSAELINTVCEELLIYKE